MKYSFSVLIFLVSLIIIAPTKAVYIMTEEIEKRDKYEVNTSFLNKTNITEEIKPISEDEEEGYYRFIKLDQLRKQILPILNTCKEKKIKNIDFSFKHITKINHVNLFEECLDVITEFEQDFIESGYTYKMPYFNTIYFSYPNLNEDLYSETKKVESNFKAKKQEMIRETKNNIAEYRDTPSDFAKRNGY